MSVYRARVSYPASVQEARCMLGRAIRRRRLLKPRGLGTCSVIIGHARELTSEVARGPFVIFDGSLGWQE